MRIRPFDKSDADYALYVEIANANYPDHPYSVDELRHEDETWNYARFDKARWLAEIDNRTVVGYGELSHRQSEFHPQKFWFDVYVHPDHQRRGYGDVIYRYMETELTKRNATEAQTATNETKPEVIGFLERRGFTELRRSWESRLDVTAFDENPFKDAEPRVIQQGITFTTLADELERDPEGAKRRAHALHEAVNADVPRSGTYTPRAYEDWISMLDAPDALPDGYLIAKHNDEWVAESCLWRNTTFPDVLQQGLTGALPAYRGRGIAMALKVRGVRYAREHGYREIRTHNDTANLPMLRINEAMGFVKQPAWIFLQKTFE